MVISVKGIELLPGNKAKITTALKSVEMMWGIFNMPIAHLDDLNDYWKSIKGNKGIVEVEYFIIDKTVFKDAENKLISVACLFHGEEFAILTANSKRAYAQYHKNMPIIIDSITREAYLFSIAPVSTLYECSRFNLIVG